MRLSAPVSNDLIAVAVNMPNYPPNVHVEEKVDWVLISDKQFSIRYAWNAMGVHHPNVQWHAIVWHKDNLPRCSSILWLVCKNRTRTKDKLMQWGGVTDGGCVLCGGDDESKGHLFFIYHVSLHVCRSVLRRLGIDYSCNRGSVVGGGHHEIQRQ